jgi:lactoylglutathione lyase
VSIEDAIASIAALNDAGLRPESGIGEVISEPEVIPWIPSASVYFKDPDGHSLEYIAMLPDAPAPRMDRMPLSKWRDLQATLDPLRGT